MTKAAVQLRISDSFDDDTAPAPNVWNHLAATGDTNVVFLTYPWQKPWWDVYGRGKLLLVTASHDNQLVATASLFADGGMIFFVGSGGSDYLDFIGRISPPRVLDAILLSAREQVRDFVGFRFYLVPDDSRTSSLLTQTAERLGLDIYDEGELAAPFLDLRTPGVAEKALNKQSLRRRERYFDTSGGFVVHDLRSFDEVLPHLDHFFEQHVRRWETTPFPSLFLDPANRRFYRELARATADAGWLRFTRIDWQDRAIAFHFGFCYHGSYLWYKPTFAIDLARHGPGELLLRRLIMAAVAEGASIFDFGIGDEAFKQRFATGKRIVRTWGLYPRVVGE